MHSKKQYTIYRVFNEKFIQDFDREKFEELDIYPDRRCFIFDDLLRHKKSPLE